MESSDSISNLQNDSTPTLSTTSESNVSITQTATSTIPPSSATTTTNNTNSTATTSISISSPPQSSNELNSGQKRPDTSSHYDPNSNSHPKRVLISPGLNGNNGENISKNAQLESSFPHPQNNNNNTQNEPSVSESDSSSRNINNSKDSNNSNDNDLLGNLHDEDPYSSALQGIDDTEQLKFLAEQLKATDSSIPTTQSVFQPSNPRQQTQPRPARESQSQSLPSSGNSQNTGSLFFDSTNPTSQSSGESIPTTTVTNTNTNENANENENTNENANANSNSNSNANANETANTSKNKNKNTNTMTTSDHVLQYANNHQQDPIPVLQQVSETQESVNLLDYQMQDPIANLRVQSIPILDNLATQILNTLTKPGHLDSLGIATSPDTAEGQAFQVLISLFTQTKTIYCDAEFINAEAIELDEDSYCRQMIQKANLATFVAALFGVYPMSFYLLDYHFLDTFVYPGSRLLKPQAALYLDLKTQAYIVTVQQRDDPKEYVLSNTFPDNIAQILLSRRGTKVLAPSEADFVQRMKRRKDHLAALPVDSELSQNYRWLTFIRDIADYVNKNLSVILTGKAAKSVSSASQRARNKDDNSQANGQGRKHNSNSESSAALKNQKQNKEMSPTLSAEAQQGSISPSSKNSEVSKSVGLSMVADSGDVIHDSNTEYDSPGNTSASVLSSGNVVSNNVVSSEDTVMSNNNLDGSGKFTQNTHTQPSQAASSSTTSHSTLRTSYFQRRPWTSAEESALLEGLATVKGPYWSQILEMYGPGGKISEVLKDRNQVQLKDKARNLKLYYLKTNTPMPDVLKNVTGDVRTRDKSKRGRKARDMEASRAAAAAAAAAAATATATTTAPPTTTTKATTVANNNSSVDTPIITQTSQPASQSQRQSTPSQVQQPQSQSQPQTQNQQTLSLPQSQPQHRRSLDLVDILDSITSASSTPVPSAVAASSTTTATTTSNTSTYDPLPATISISSSTSDTSLPAISSITTATNQNVALQSTATASITNNAISPSTNSQPSSISGQLTSNSVITTSTSSTLPITTTASQPISSTGPTTLPIPVSVSESASTSAHVTSAPPDVVDEVSAMSLDTLIQRVGAYISNEEKRSRSSSPLKEDYTNNTINTQNSSNLSVTNSIIDKEVDSNRKQSEVGNNNNINSSVNAAAAIISAPVLSNKGSNEKPDGEDTSSVVAKNLANNDNSNTKNIVETTGSLNDNNNISSQSNQSSLTDNLTEKSQNTPVVVDDVAENEREKGSKNEDGGQTRELELERQRELEQEAEILRSVNDLVSRTTTGDDENDNKREGEGNGNENGGRNNSINERNEEEEENDENEEALQFQSEAESLLKKLLEQEEMEEKNGQQSQLRQDENEKTITENNNNNKENDGESKPSSSSSTKQGEEQEEIINIDDSVDSALQAVRDAIMIEARNNTESGTSSTTNTSQNNNE